MSNPFKLKVGQKLFCVNFSVNKGSSSGEWLTISKVGRRWAELKDGQRVFRVDIDNLLGEANYRGVRGSVYLDEESYIAEVNLKTAWIKVSDYIKRQYFVPDGVTLGDLQKISELLKLK